VVMGGLIRTIGKVLYMISTIGILWWLCICLFELVK
jgi:hypothetical protein